MLIEVLIAVCIGILAGIVTGLTPGIHINLVAVMLLSAAPFLLIYAPAVALACFIISMSVTHTFLDAIPSIFLGAPDSDEALGMLPGHRYLLAGHGMKAVKLTIIGSFGAILLSIILFPLFIIIVRYGYPIVSKYIGWLLVATAVFMILRDNKKLWAILIFLLSGCLGIIVLNIPNFSNPLLPMLSGLFGVSTLLISLYDKQNIPEQKNEKITTIRKGIIPKALISGQFSGFLTSVLPGLSASIAAIMSLQITKKLGDQGFMILLGSIGTVNFVLSMSALYVINKARNGSIIAVQELLPSIDIKIIVLFLSVTLVTGSIGTLLCLWIGKGFSVLITKVNYSILVTGVIIFVVLLTTALTGLLGFLVLFVSTALGILPAKVKVTRTHSMGCLLLPVILYFML